MKRAKFHIDPRDYQAAADAAKAADVSVAEFIRKAVAEKLDRELALREVQTVRDELSSLLTSLRQETKRSQQQLVENSALILEKHSEKAGLSHRKNEELVRAFIAQMAAMADGGQRPAGSPASPYSRSHLPD